MTTLSSARQSEVKAWEEEIVPCEHTLTLQQEASDPIPASGVIKSSTRSHETCDQCWSLCQV